MTTVLRVLAAIALLALIALLTLLVILINAASPKITSTLDNLNRSLVTLNATLAATQPVIKNFDDATATAKGAAVEQRKYWQMSSKQTYKAITDAKGLIARTDISLNRVLVPRIDATLKAQSESMLETQASLRSEIAAAQETTIAGQKVLEVANVHLADPNIKESLANLNDSAKNLSASMEQFRAILTDGRQMADKARETYMKPVNLWWGLVKTFLPLAGSAAQVAK